MKTSLYTIFLAIMLFSAKISLTMDQFPWFNNFMAQTNATEDAAKLANEKRRQKIATAKLNAIREKWPNFRLIDNSQTKSK